MMCYNRNMRLAIYLNNLDESYQITFYTAAQARATELGIDILCVQEKLLSGGKMFFPSRSYISVDGIITLTASLLNESPASFGQKLRSSFSDVPVISAGIRIPGIPSLIIKATASMEYIMRHLLYVHNYRNFLYIGGPERHQDNIVRETAYRRALDNARKLYPLITSDIRYANFTEYSGMTALEGYIETHRGKPPDAIVCANDMTAIGVLNTIQAQQDPRWRNCAVTGFDDIETAQTNMKSLTTVCQPISNMGRIAIDTIDNLLIGKIIPETVLIDSYPIIRNSCGCTDISWQKQTEINRKNRRDISNYTAQIQYEQAKTSLTQQHVSYFGRIINSARNMEEIIAGLRDFLGNAGIQTFYFILFKSETSSEAKKGQLIYQKTPDGELYYTPPKDITLKTFFDAEVFSSKNGPSDKTVHYLTAGTETLGMIIYTADNSIHPQLCSCSIFLANAIKQIRALDKEKKRSLELEKEVEKRTVNLVAANRKLKKESKRRIKVEAEILKISEQERQRFSMDLHDDICQRLAGISMFCRGMSSQDSRLQELSDMVEETLRRTRQYAHNSFPIELDSLGMQKAVETLCHTTERQNGQNIKIPFSWETNGELHLDRTKKINIYRIIQEALHNAVKYANASEIRVSIIQSGNILTVTVKDNGTGNSSIPTKKNNSAGYTGLGIRSIRYRADQMEATLAILSSVKKGTTIRLKIPLTKSPQKL